MLLAPPLVAQFPPQHQHILNRVRTDLKFFASRELWIKTKDGKLKRLVFNDAQDYIHKRLESQRARTGKVRAIIIKGRQQGSSTYVLARFFHKAICKAAQTVFILSHESKSTAKLFSKIDLFYRKASDFIKPKQITANRHEQKYTNESEYGVATAGSEDAGRSGTAQLFHASEAAFYVNEESFRSGALQIVANLPDTEIIFESTCNGMNWFYEFTMEALQGKGEYEVIFVPWFWQPEYATEPRPGFKLDKDERKIAELHGLSLAQMQWRRDKIVELKSERLFKQEYPCTIVEAFQATGGAFFEPDLVEKAQQCKLRRGYGALVMGVDPGRKRDRTVIVLRRGRVILDVITYPKMNEMKLAGIVADMIDTYDVDKCFIDWGHGGGTIDRLWERGYRHKVEGVDFGSSPKDDRYANKRAEMYFDFKEWLDEPEVSMPDSMDIATDLSIMPDYELTSGSRIIFPSKKDIRKATGKSPDIADAIVLTFAEKVRADDDVKAVAKKSRRQSVQSSAIPGRRARLKKQGKERYDEFDDEDFDEVAEYRNRKDTRARRRIGRRVA